ncbi:MAG: hypothetical protein IIY02_06115 [Firmicutes bacterium]|nr:hypothetical protein [Bacillota bacterium]
MADLEFSEVFGGDAVGSLTGKRVSDDELFADLGMIDPYTGTPIVTKADFLAWKERFLAEREHAPAEEEIPAESAVSAMMEAEWTKIREIDPAIGDLETLADQPYFPRIYEKVLRGYALADAFALVKAEEQRRFAAARAKQNLDRKSRGKEHLKATAQRGGGEVTISEAELAEFQRLLPDATKDDIRRFYKKDHKRKGRK